MSAGTVGHIVSNVCEAANVTNELSMSKHYATFDIYDALSKIR